MSETEQSLVPAGETPQEEEVVIQVVVSKSVYEALEAHRKEMRKEYADMSTGELHVIPVFATVEDLVEDVVFGFAYPILERANVAGMREHREEQEKARKAIRKKVGLKVRKG